MRGRDVVGDQGGGCWRMRIPDRGGVRWCLIIAYEIIMPFCELPPSLVCAKHKTLRTLDFTHTRSIMSGMQHCFICGNID